MEDRVILAITARGMVPRTMEGRIKWLTADLKAPGSLDLKASISINPVSTSTQKSADNRPETGVHPRKTEKNKIIKRPHQKIGMEYPVRDAPIIVWSKAVPLLTPARIPAGSPIKIAKIMAQKDSSSVAGKRIKNSSRIGFLVT